MKPKAKKCAVCKISFTPTKPLQQVCDFGCAIELSLQKRVKLDAQKAKQERQERRQAIIKARPLSWYRKQAEIAINRYVRLRDIKDGCISCDKPANWGGQWHASHFRSVGASSATRFNLWNIHKACSICNNWKSGNLAEYEPRLRAKIGDEKVDWLKSQNQIVRYSQEYLIRIKQIFTKKAKLKAKLAH